MRNSITCTDSNKRKKYTAIFILLVFAVLLFLVLNIVIGSVSVSLSEIIRIFTGKSGSDTFGNIVLKIRFPRALAAIILGGALALSGYLLQTFFHNPIAGPFVLGISSGAKLVVALSMVFLLGSHVKITSIFMIIAAFTGAMISMGFVLLISKKLRHSSMLIVSGIMIGYICSAITDLVVTFADDSDIVNLRNWSMGSFSGITWSNIKVMTVVILVTSILVFFMSKSIAAYQMGETYARNMGVNIRGFKIALVIFSSILSACVTAFAGPVSFVGIAVPQIIKNVFHTAKPIIMIPACFLGGAVWCLICDLIARTMFAPTELSISTVTAIFGVPVVIYVLIHSRKERLH